LSHTTKNVLPHLSQSTGIAYEALAAVLGDTQSLHTNSMDEVLALPSEKATRDYVTEGEIISALKEVLGEYKMVFGGGIIPNEDITKLKEMGIEELFTPGTDTDIIVKFLRKKFK
jgi:methylmalonyl-CoA mutase cobalamin-binding domain/chain